MSSVFQQNRSNLIALRQRPKSHIRRLFDIYGEIGLNTRKTKEQIVQQARQIFLEWMKRKTYMPLEAYDGKSFTVKSHFGYPPAEGIALDGFWAVQFVDDDSTVANRKWVTEFYLDFRGETVKMCARQSCAIRALNPSPEILPDFPRLPHFIRTICDQLGLFDDDFAFDETPWEIEDDSSFQSFMQLLQNPDRSRPILALSKRSQTGEPMLSPEFLAKHTLGMAHVVVLNSRYCWRLEEELGRDLSLWDGAIRTYQPGFTEDDEAIQHRVLVSRKIESWPGGTGALNAFIINKLSHSCFETLKEQKNLYAFSELRQQYLSAMAEAAPTTDLTGLQEQLEGYKRQVDSLEEEKDYYFQAALDAEAESDEVEKKAEALEGQYRNLLETIKFLRDENKQLRERLSEANFTTTYPDSMAELREWAMKNLGGKVIILDKAYRAAKKANYDNIPLVYQALEMLGNEYRELKLGQGTREAFHARLQELNLDDELTFAEEASAKAFGQTYYASWSGRNRWFEKHLKKGIARDQRNCLRIYYFWDEETEQVIIGSLPNHLETRAS